MQLKGTEDCTQHMGYIRYLSGRYAFSDDVLKFTKAGRTLGKLPNCYLYVSAIIFRGGQVSSRGILLEQTRNPQFTQHGAITCTSHVGIQAVYVDPDPFPICNTKCHS